MESLEDRFETVQEKLLDLLESSPETIDEQIQFWDLTRWENVYLNAARRKGITKLGLTPVPPLQASENGAKEAIQMKMYLTLLKDSGFNSEKWTLSDTSTMTFHAPPKHCFKKRPRAATVVFDDDPQNAVRHTVWMDVYFLNDHEMFQKTSSHVDVHGIYYVNEDGDKLYYANFAEDAKKYSVTGQWEIKYNNKLYSSSVASSTGDSTTLTAEPQEDAVSSSQQSPRPSTSTDPPETKEDGNSTARLIRHTYYDILRPKSRNTGPRGTETRSRSRSTSRSTSPSTRRARRRTGRRGPTGGCRRSTPRRRRRSRSGSRGGRRRVHSRSRTRSTSAARSGVSEQRSAPSTPSTRSISRASSSCYAESRQRSALVESITTPPPPTISPWFGRSIGQSCGSSPRAHRGRSANSSRTVLRPTASGSGSRSRSRERLHTPQQKDPYVILVRGRANQLKCWRWRLLNRKRRVPFRCFSTTFSWVSLKAGDRPSLCRMLVVFDSKHDRETFVKEVSFPPGVTWCNGHLDCL